MARAMEVNVATHPVEVGILCANAAMLQADLVVCSVEQAWLRRGNVGGWEG